MPNVTVGNFELDSTVWFPDSGVAGGAIVGGGTFWLNSTPVNQNKSDTCQVTDVSTETGGFTVVGSEVPLVVRPGNAASLTVRVHAPLNGTYVQDVALSVSVQVL